MFPGPQLSRVRRQTGGGNTVANCDFGSGQSVDTCGWENLDNLTRWISSNIYTISSNIYTISSNIYNVYNPRSLRWTASKGDDAFWIGGPRHDHNDPNTLQVNIHTSIDICVDISIYNISTRGREDMSSSRPPRCLKTRSPAEAPHSSRVRCSPPRDPR